MNDRKVTLAFTFLAKVTDHGDERITLRIPTQYYDFYGLHEKYIPDCRITIFDQAGAQIFGPDRADMHLVSTRKFARVHIGKYHRSRWTETDNQLRNLHKIIGDVVEVYIEFFTKSLERKKPDQQ